MREPGIDAPLGEFQPRGSQACAAVGPPRAASGDASLAAWQPLDAPSAGGDPARGGGAIEPLMAALPAGSDPKQDGTPHGAEASGGGGLAAVAAASSPADRDSPQPGAGSAAGSLPAPDPTTPEALAGGDGADRATAIAAEALDLLEWPRLSSHVASFASTAAGTLHCASLPLPATAAASRELLAETGELLGLDGLIEGGLSFRGVADIRDCVARCAKGGTAGGEAPLAVASTLAAARRLRRQIDDEVLRPVCSALVADLRTLPEQIGRAHV